MFEGKKSAKVRRNKENLKKKLGSKITCNFIENL